MEHQIKTTLVAVFKDNGLVKCQVTEFDSIEQAGCAMNNIKPENKIFAQTFIGTVPVNVSLLLNNGRLNCDAAFDPDYPGFDTEFVHMNEEEWGTRPRILVEAPTNVDQILTRVWADPDNEDYTDKIRCDLDYRTHRKD